MYYCYMVDEYMLQVLGFLWEIEQGLYVDEYLLLIGIICEIKNCCVLYFVVLLYDIGKGNGDQCIEGVVCVLIVCECLGLDSDESEFVVWLIENYLLMSDIVQCCDIGDLWIIVDFV